MNYSIMISIFGLAVATVNFNPVTTSPDYKFLKKEKQISLSSRELKLSDGRSTRELRAEFTVNGSLAKMREVLQNERLSRQWMKGVKDYSLIGTTGDNWKAYIQYDIPWPLNNQDCIINYTSNLSGNGTSLTIKMNSQPDFLPKKPGVERISHLSGCWTITGVTEKNCRVVYTVYSEQKARFPRWATDPIIQQNLINSLSAFRELAEK